MSRTIPKVNSKNPQSNQLPVRQIVQKPDSDESDNYSDDFEVIYPQMMIHLSFYREKMLIRRLLQVEIQPNIDTK